MASVYPINSLFFYRLLFMGTLILGETIFCYKLERKKHFFIKMPLTILFCLLFALAFPIPTGNAFYSMAMFFIMFAFTFLMARWIFKSDWRMLLFCLSCGYTTEHISYEFYSSLSNFFVVGESRPGGMYDYDSLSLFLGPVDFAFWLFSFINIYWLLFIFFARRIEKGRTFNTSDSLKVLLIGIFFILIDVVLNSIVSYYSSIHYDKYYMGLFALINAICCILGIFFIFEMYYRSNLNREYAIMQEIRNEEINQYKVSKETIDLINIKCHDFRHQIRKLGREQNIDEEAIKNINKLIKIYDSSIKTNNNALNVILSEKSLTCSKYDINFTCLVDGELLNFMSEEDIYSLFGNIVENAIEAVKPLNIEKRSISLRVKKVGNMITIVEKNSYDGKIELENGIPKSTKGDKRYHGFGFKSINLVVNKYNGTLDLDIKNNIFTITILFIRPSKKE